MPRSSSTSCREALVEIGHGLLDDNLRPRRLLRLLPQGDSVVGRDVLAHRLAVRYGSLKGAACYLDLERLAG